MCKRESEREKGAEIRGTRMRLTVLQVEDKERERERLCVCMRKSEREMLVKL